MNDKVLLGMSGGVDSSVAAVLLQRQGYDVVGVTMRLWSDPRFAENDSGCCSINNVYDAKRVCDRLSIPHYVINLEDDFKKFVIDNFVSEYSKCRTPNPCIECNRYLKFSAMLKRADELAIKYIATGHYARCMYDDKYARFVLKRSPAEKKDQSYVLYCIKQKNLERILFPLGEFNSKEEIRQIALECGFVNAKKPDSQEICFIPDDDHVRFLDEHIKPIKGKIADVKGKMLGIHTGLTHYTIGQRKGLGISAPEPLYVLSLDSGSNTITAGQNQQLYTNELYAEKINLLLFDKLAEPIRVMAKIRYLAKPSAATVYPQEDGKLKVVFDSPQRAVTAGQSIVFYIDDYVMGGGLIS